MPKDVPTLTVSEKDEHGNSVIIIATAKASPELIRKATRAVISKRNLYLTEAVA